MDRSTPHFRSAASAGKTPIGIGALAQFEVLLAAAKGKQIVMFLDYDGTLSPIVEDPDCAVMSEEVGQQSSPPFSFSARCKRFLF
jgi:hypothetical protein